MKAATNPDLDSVMFTIILKEAESCDVFRFVEVKADRRRAYFRYFRRFEEYARESLKTKRDWRKEIQRHLRFPSLSKYIFLLL